MTQHPRRPRLSRPSMLPRRSWRRAGCLFRRSSTRCSCPGGRRCCAAIQPYERGLGCEGAAARRAIATHGRRTTVVRGVDENASELGSGSAANRQRRQKEGRTHTHDGPWPPERASVIHHGAGGRLRGDDRGPRGRAEAVAEVGGATETLPVSAIATGAELDGLVDGTTVAGSSCFGWVLDTCGGRWRTYHPAMTISAVTTTPPASQRHVERVRRSA